MNNEFIFEPSILPLFVFLLVFITAIIILQMRIYRTDEITKCGYKTVKDMINEYPQLKRFVPKNKITSRDFDLLAGKYNALKKEIKEKKETVELDKAKSVLYNTINNDTK